MRLHGQIVLETIFVEKKKFFPEPYHILSCTGKFSRNTYGMVCLAGLHDQSAYERIIEINLYSVLYNMTSEKF